MDAMCGPVVEFRSSRSILLLLDTTPGTGANKKSLAHRTDATYFTPAQSSLT
jgi:hypothetical protein